MSIADIWGDVKCPKCGKKTMHVYYFDSNHMSDSTQGGRCRSCKHKATQKQTSKGIETLRDRQRKREKKEHEALVKRCQEEEEKNKKAKAMMDELGIPTSTMFSLAPHVYATQLYDIFTDEKKCKALITRLRNRALW